MCHTVRHAGALATYHLSRGCTQTYQELCAACELQLRPWEEGQALAQVAWLLDRGLNLEAQDNQGDTPLHYAVFYTQRAVVLLLLSKGAHVAAKNKEVSCRGAWRHQGRQFLQEVSSSAAHVVSTSIAAVVGHVVS